MSQNHHLRVEAGGGTKPLLPLPTKVLTPPTLPGAQAWVPMWTEARGCQLCLCKGVQSHMELVTATDRNRRQQVDLGGCREFVWDPIKFEGLSKPPRGEVT